MKDKIRQFGVFLLIAVMTPVVWGSGDQQDQQENYPPDKESVDKRADPQDAKAETQIRKPGQEKAESQEDSDELRENPEPSSPRQSDVHY